MTKQDSAIEYTMAEQDFLYAIDFIGQQYFFIVFFTFHESTCKYKKNAIHSTMYCIFICLTTYYTEIWNPHLSDMLKVVPETVSIKKNPLKALDFQGI